MFLIVVVASIVNVVTELGPNGRPGEGQNEERPRGLPGVGGVIRRRFFLRFGIISRSFLGPIRSLLPFVATCPLDIGLVVYFRYWCSTVMVGVIRQLDDRAISPDDNVPQRQYRLELGPVEGRVADGKLAQEVVPTWIEGGGGHGRGFAQQEKMAANLWPALTMLPVT